MLIIDFAAITISAITLILSRFDRNRDGGYLEAFLELQRRLDLVVEAAEMTQKALARGAAPSKTALQMMGMQVKSHFAFHEWIEPTGLQEMLRRSSSLKSLLDVYAPETSDWLRSSSDDRLLVLAQFEEGAQPSPEITDETISLLDETFRDLQQAQQSLRTFIAANFDL